MMQINNRWLWHIERYYNTVSQAIQCDIFNFNFIGNLLKCKVNFVQHYHQAILNNTELYQYFLTPLLVTVWWCDLISAKDILSCRTFDNIFSISIRTVASNLQPWIKQEKETYVR